MNRQIQLKEFIIKIAEHGLHQMMDGMFIQKDMLNLILVGQYFVVDMAMIQCMVMG